jgi:hypothetical protein
MARYRFTRRDLEPLREFLELPLAKEVFAAATPIKHFEPATREVDETIELPVAVQSREQPDGVPLHEILAAVKRRSPTVTGLAVRGDRLMITHSQPPAAKERRELASLLGDRQELLSLRPAGQRDREARPTRGEPGGLEALLRDDAVSDAEWLKAFRRWAVARLLPPPE